LTAATLFIDLQVDFFSSHPRLIQNRSRLTANVNGLAAISRSNGAYIVWIKQIFAADLHDAPDVVRRGGYRITVEGTAGAQLLPEIGVDAADYTIVKKRYSAFFGTELDTLLRRMACDRIVIAGINTHACVRITAVDAYQRDYEVLLARDCIDSYDQVHHDISMRYMDGKIGVALTNIQLEAELQDHT
jgi:nicotinamidase-related amidase